MFFGRHVTYFPNAATSANIASVGLGIAGLLDAHDNWAAQSPVIRNVDFEVEVVENRQILVLHARVQAKRVVSDVLQPSTAWFDPSQLRSAPPSQ